VDAIEVVDVLGRLVAKSLIVAEAAEGVTRYRMLETLRDFAWEHLQTAGEADAAARREDVTPFVEVRRWPRLLQDGIGLGVTRKSGWRFMSRGVPRW
jgi:hypothetical protein